MIDDVSQEKIMEAYNNSVMKNEILLKEASSSGGLIGVADIFARYLIGDRNVAISQLKQLQSQVPTDFLAGIEPNDYNKKYQDLTKDLFKAIKKHMK